MREIQSLQVMSVRAAGSNNCSIETTFSPDADKKPSQASRLLRSFHKRRDGEAGAESIESIPLSRTPCIGVGSFRREHANEVDLFHPVIGCREHENGSGFIMEFGNPALDCLQGYIDSLVESGRMDDTRLGRHFFEEYKANIILGAKQKLDDDEGNEGQSEPSQKRRRSSDGLPIPSKDTPLGSLSLYNCTLSVDSVKAMVESGICSHLAVLDLTGVHGLHDDIMELLIPHCVNLKRLSLKNCRCITVKTLRLVAQYQASLVALDLGGSFNVSADDVIEIVPMLTQLKEIHVSGLSWTDDALDKLVSTRAWSALSLNFSMKLSQAALRTSLIKISDSLVALALAFCENVVDNTLLGMLGRNLPHLKYLDVRGNSSLTTLTGWYDGRTSADLPPQPLLVLGRYSGLTTATVDETQRVHPHMAADLQTLLDGNGMGKAITR